MAAVAELNSGNFREWILSAQIPVLVEFYAPWCPKCAMMADLVEELASEQEGKISVCRIDADYAKEISEQYGVERVPVFILFCGGKAERAVSGIVSKKVLKELAGIHQPD